MFTPYKRELAGMGKMNTRICEIHELCDPVTDAVALFRIFVYFLDVETTSNVDNNISFEHFQILLSKKDAQAFCNDIF